MTAASDAWRPVRAGALEASRQARLWSWIGFGAGLAVALLYLLILAVASLAAD